MSAKQSGGSCLEGTPPVPVDIGLQTGLFDRFGQETNVTAEDLHETLLDRGQAEETNMRSRIKIGGVVDVARRIRSLRAAEPNKYKRRTPARRARIIGTISSAVALFILTLVFLAGLS